MCQFLTADPVDQKFIEDSMICHNYLESLQSSGHTLPDEVTEAIKRAKNFEFVKNEKKGESVDNQPAEPL